jgi:hypothetical protein
MNRLAVAVLAAFCFAPKARAADLACDTPGIAQMIIPDLFNNNPSAQKLGLEVSKVTVLSIQETTEGRVCLVAVLTNHRSTFRYLFKLGADGIAALDLAP